MVVHDLCVGQVLRGISFELESGALGVVGRNGAGKSTLLAALCGALPPDAGQVSGLEGAAWLPESCPLDPELPVAWLRRLARRLPGWDPVRAAELDHSIGVPVAGSCGSLSQGQRVRLGLWLTLSRRAPAYVLDDPFLGLDPEAKRAAESQIAAIEAPLVLACQDADSVRRLCTHVLVIERGAVAWTGVVEDWDGALNKEQP